jgi:hypothetical protein
MLEARTEQARGDWSGAMRSCLDAEQFGAALPHGSVLGRIEGIDIQLLGNRRAAGLVEYLGAVAAAAAARRLAAIDRSQVSAADALQEDKWFHQAVLLEIFRSPDPEKAIGKFFGSKAVGLILAWDPYDTVMDNYTRYADDCIAVAKLPYQKSVHTSIPTPADTFNRLFVIPDTAETRLAHVNCVNRLLEVQLALRAYYVNHGRYPTALNVLVPAYVPSVPADPYADSGLLRYRLAAKRYVLYSVGPDGVDDGGKPIVNPKGDAYGRYGVRDEARGDFVAGVNY